MFVEKKERRKEVMKEREEGKRRKEGRVTTCVTALPKVVLTERAFCDGPAHFQ